MVFALNAHTQAKGGFSVGKILGIGIKNYGTLKDISMGRLFNNQKGIPLGNMVAIIGSSGNGKSTLADAFGFLSDCLATDVESACDLGNRGGFESLISQGAQAPIHFEIYYREANNEYPITYELTIAADKAGRPYVHEERLRQRRQERGQPLSFLYLTKGKGYVFEGDGGQAADSNEITGKKVEIELTESRKLGIATLGAMKQYGRVEKFLAFMRSWYLCYFSPDKARQIQMAQPTPYLDRTGSNLNSVAQYMHRENPADFKRILTDIQTKLPSIERIDTVKLLNGQLALQFWQRGFDKPFYSQRMSDGTLKLFAYYLLLHERNARQLVFIEEPENGLYHQYLADLATDMERLVGKGYSKQLFITTHSPFFVNALRPEQVWVLEKDESGYSTIKRASEYKFVEELVEEGAPMGDLWYSNYFN